MSSRVSRASITPASVPGSRARAPVLHLEGSLWIMAGETPLGGSGRIELLERIEASGSIRQAALAMGMSYRAAWTAVSRMEERLGQPLVRRATGGVGGGGAELSAIGRGLIEAFRAIEARHRAWLDELTKELTALTAPRPATEKGGGRSRRRLHHTRG